MASSQIRPQLPFPRFSPSVGRGLLLAAVVVGVAEAVFVARIIRERGLFEYVALDYRGTRTAGEAILEHGLGASFQPELLEAAQRELYDRYVHATGRGVLPFGIVPAPYPPPFSLIFVPSTLVDPVPGFLVWTGVHLVVLLLYQVRLSKVFRVSGPGWLIAAVMLSPPVLIHLIMGQISVWLMVFFGEAMIAFHRGRLFRAGVWLGLLVVKPQTLVLIVPVLVVNRQWRALGGLAAACVSALAPTLIVAGSWMAGYVDGLSKFFGATGMIMNSFPNSMTNWRAFALNASRILPPIVAWGGAVVGMAVTGVAGLVCGRDLRIGARAVEPVAWLGLAAATNAFTWHAHVHQALLLVPPLYWVVGRWPDLKELVAAVCLGLALVFLVPAFSTNIGLAHDLLGTAFLAVLVSTAVGCAVVIRAAGFSSSEVL